MDRNFAFYKSRKNVITILFILALVAMRNRVGKARYNCVLIGDKCGPGLNSCCAQLICGPKNICMEDPYHNCKLTGEKCGFIFGKCCIGAGKCSGRVLRSRCH
ncbi:uncharacterized protein [Spinacia oleracea]|uniref:Uncharacterized protein n=1 Tax=Spinacia oleracea TaxID=3562 RepID=A0ABM3RCB5_SPIOL|nr:uncharacterized protein LOC130467999 [Spinacia oleracea]